MYLFAKLCWSKFAHFTYIEYICISIYSCIVKYILICIFKYIYSYRYNYFKKNKYLHKKILHIYTTCSHALLRCARKRNRTHEHTRYIYVYK